MTDQRVLDVLYAAGPQWGDRKPEDIVSALDAAGYKIVPKYPGADYVSVPPPPPGSGGARALIFEIFGL